MGEIQRLDMKLSVGIVPPTIAFFALPSASSRHSGAAAVSSLGRTLDPLLSGAAEAVRQARTSAEQHMAAAFASERALSDPANLQIDVLLRAPRLILPRDATAVETDLVVLTLGEIRVSNVDAQKQLQQCAWYDTLSLSDSGVHCLLLRGSPLGHG
jgi:hypothetical protein